MNFKSFISGKIPLLIIGFLVVSYIVFRAFSLDITYDEAWSIDIYIPLEYAELWNYDYPNANNHLLNSLLIKYFFSYGNESDFIARLPNVLAGIMYVFFAYKIAQEFFVQHKLFLFVLLLFNPFLLDFFSLARGYGLSLAFLLGACFFLLKYAKSAKMIFAFMALACAGLSVMSSFTMIYIFAAVLFLVFWIAFFSKLNWKNWALLSIGAAIIVKKLYDYVHIPFEKLMESNSLWYGGVDGFYSDTLVSLTTAIMGGHEAGQHVLVILNVLILLLVAVIVLRFFAEKMSDWNWKSPTIILVALLLIPIAESMFNHYVLGTKFLLDRTALFLYPLAILLLVQLANVSRPSIYSKCSSVLTAVATGFVVINFILCFNLKSTITWFQDAHTRDVLSELNEKGEKENRKVAFDASWPFRATVLYYLDDKRNAYPNVEFVEAEPEYLDSSKAEYYMFLGISLYNVGYRLENEIVPNFKRDTVLYFEREKIVLLKNKTCN
jgi:hypothetical protein